MNSSSLRGLLAVPAYNEAAGLKLLVMRLRECFPELDVLVVDDGSRDETAATLQQLGVVSARHLCNLGYGRAIQTALRYAIAGHYDYVLTVDGDGQHPPEEARLVLDHFLSSDLDVCIGSRFIATRNYAGTPWSRRLGMITFSWMARLVTGQRFYDTTSGLKAMRRTVFEPLTRWNFVDFHAEAIVYLMRLGWSVGEYPVTMQDRRHGQSMYKLADLVTYPLKTLMMVIIASAQASLTRRTRHP
jgi:glycosyltransferase involved in cell wall biosynthesis